MEGNCPFGLCVVFKTLALTPPRADFLCKVTPGIGVLGGVSLYKSHSLFLAPLSDLWEVRPPPQEGQEESRHLWKEVRKVKLELGLVLG